MKKLPDHILRQRVNAYLNSRNINDDTISKLNLDEMLHEIMVYHEELAFQNDELQNTEQKCLRLQNEYNTLLDIIGDIVIYVNEDYEIIKASASFYKKVYTESMRSSHEDFRRIFHIDDQDLLFHGLKNINEGHCVIENIRLKNDDTLYELRCRQLIHNNNEPYYILALVYSTPK